MQPLVRVAGLGSPHGDDSVGWRLVEPLVATPRVGVEAAIVRSPLDLIHTIANCQRLIVVDAATGAGPVGTCRVISADALGFEAELLASTHGLGLVDVLNLARAMGRRLPKLEIFAVLIEPPTLNPEPSPALLRALPRLHRELVRHVSLYASECLSLASRVSPEATVHSLSSTETDLAKF